MTQPVLAKAAAACLATLIILQLVMLISLLVGLMPHPPRAIPLFAMGPFLGASLAVAAAAIIVGPLETRLGRALSGVAALCALISYGPQKWVDPAIAEIWPAVLTGEVASFSLLAMIMVPVLTGRDQAV